MRRFAEIRLEMGLITEEELAEIQDAGTPDEDISTWIDVSDLTDVKVRALRAHRSQIPEDWFMLAVPEEYRPDVMGREAFVRVYSRVDAPNPEHDLFAGLR